MKIIAIISLIGILIMSAGCLGFFEGYTGKVQEMTSADYAIGQYKFFIDKYNAIRQMGSQIYNAESSVDEYKEMHPNSEFWTRTENDNYQELTFVREGYIQQYNKFIADYNSRMRDITTNQAWMKPKDFPSDLQMYMKDSVVTTGDDTLLMPSTTPEPPEGWKPPKSDDKNG